MRFRMLQWLFPLVVTLHNTEEAIWLPAWSQHAGTWHVPVGPGEFRFAALGFDTSCFPCCLSELSNGPADSVGLPSHRLHGSHACQCVLATHRCIGCDAQLHARACHRRPAEPSSIVSVAETGPPRALRFWLEGHNLLDRRTCRLADLHTRFVQNRKQLRPVNLFSGLGRRKCGSDFLQALRRGIKRAMLNLDRVFRHVFDRLVHPVFVPGRRRRVRRTNMSSVPYTQSIRFVEAHVLLFARQPVARRWAIMRSIHNGR
jgi:hypothetical protein